MCRKEHPARSLSRLAAWSLVASLLACAVPLGNHALAQNSYTVDQMVSFNLGDPKEYRAFYGKLKTALGKGDKQTVAAMVKYPLRVNGGEEHKIPRIRSKADLIAQYDKIFTPELVAAIVDEDYEDVIARDMGVGLAGGLLWFTGACVDKSCTRRAIKVITVNMP